MYIYPTNLYFAPNVTSHTSLPVKSHRIYVYLSTSGKRVVDMSTHVYPVATPLEVDYWQNKY